MENKWLRSLNPFRQVVSLSEIQAWNSSSPIPLCLSYNSEHSWTSLTVQWLRVHAPNVGGMGSISGPGTKIPHAT